MRAEIIHGDCLEVLRGMEAGSAHCCVTSPPYFGLRDYGCEGQIGLEETPAAYVARLLEVFREVRRVLRDDGTLWLNLGDSYAGSARGRANKQLLGIPWRVAFSLQDDGWLLRSDIIWHKPNPMPESVRDRPTKSHEYLFLLAKQGRYHYDARAVSEDVVSDGHLRPRPFGNKVASARRVSRLTGNMRPGVNVLTPSRRNRRTVWTVAMRPFKGAHFACFPPALVEPCVLAGCPEGGTVLDPFAGAASAGLAAMKHGQNFVGVELNPDYCRIARDRLASATEGLRHAG